MEPVREERQLFVSVGECMVEVSPDGGSCYRVGYAGDTFNAAWTARLVLPRVRYVTCIGTDWVSDGMLALMVDAGIDTHFIRRDPARTVGLYAVRLQDGERSFAYWRAGSAATTLADDPALLSAALHGAAMILVSGITLAILSDTARLTLMAALRQARAAGARIGFDPNYRARLWPDTRHARDAVTAMYGLTDIALPTFPDEVALFGDATPARTAERIRSLGVAEIVVKNGPDPAVCFADATMIAVPAQEVASIIDTTGAGDAFNGGYLAARLQGAPVRAAVERAHAWAALAVRSKGALVPRDARPYLPQIFL